MKKIILIIVSLLFIASLSFSQETTLLTSKKGTPILPQAGDFAFGIDATPFLNYFGGFFSKSSSYSAPQFTFPNNNKGDIKLFLKYFLDKDKALRLGFEINYNYSTTDTLVIKDGQAIPDKNVTVTDRQHSSNLSIKLTPGYEIRRGAGRLQGFYGAQFDIEFGYSSQKYDYGNVMSEGDVAPSAYSFPNSNNVIPATATTPYILVTQNFPGPTFGIGLQAFVGVEYFFAPKMSVGGEFEWGPMFSSTATGVEKIEYYDTQNNVLRNEDVGTGGKTNFSIGAGNWGGSIFLMFHF